MGSINYHAIDEAISALQRGGTVIVVDDEARENEGDFVCAAETITPEIVDFMLRHGRGMLCVPVSGEIATRLGMSEMVGDNRNTSETQTPFLVMVDHRDSGTGVSAENRAKTIRAIADVNSGAEDFVRPGHVPPLWARDGGVLRRAGHTEATIDLLGMAGMRPAGALIEILSSGGSGMADHAELQALSDEFNIPIISIEELIRYRQSRERLVKREVETELPTRYGKAKLIAYSVQQEDQVPLALTWGDLRSVPAPLVRMHSSCLTGDLLASLRCDCGDQLHLAMAKIGQEGVGAVVYLPQEGRGIGLLPKLKAYALQDQGYDTVEANHLLGFKADMRDYMIGLQILRDLGLGTIRLLTNNPKKTDAFPYAGMGLEVVEQVPVIAAPVKDRERYLATKRDKMGHVLPLN